ncbi:MAG: OmpA family protein [Candidatus Omnitrophica bacterium]|nr:OmpA family protein [Candidatus Omnitrophota bacterium]
MRGIPLFLAAALGSMVMTGCGVNFYSGRPSDVHRIKELSAEMDRLKSQKMAEVQQLKDAQALLEQRLRKEIGDKQVTLEMAERGLVLTFVSEVLFDSGKAKIRPEAEGALSKVASVIQEKVADREIGIEGHTDDQPIKASGWRSNWELSTARATSVLHLLEEKGVSPRQMVAAGYGQYRPVTPNDSSGGRQQNRRVEIVILPKKLTRSEQALLRRAQASAEPEVASKAKELEEYK